MEHINLLHVLVVAVVLFVVGMLWHGPVFGKVWMRLMNFSPDSMKAMPLTAGQAVSLAVPFTLLLAGGLVYLASALGLAGVSGALCLTSIAALCFTVPVVANGFLWEGKSAKLFGFNVAYQLVAVFVASLVAVFLA